MQLYNTLSRSKEAFTPLNEGRVNMYVCGITAYDYCHIGHARSAVVFDVLVRYLRFPGRALFSGLVSAPMVMPEVIIGLSLLLLMVAVQQAIGWPQRRATTIVIGHTLLGMAYATVVISARLREMDRRIEEAAMDLGCKPSQVFFLVTIPMIAQALLSAWLLTFTLSLDDVVLSAFLSGPGSTTLPLVIFSRARLGLNPSVNAIATVVVVIVAIGVAIASYMIAKQERRRANEMAAAQRGHG